MKVLVNVRVPAVSIQYDIFIPDSLQVQAAAALIASAAEELSSNVYVPSGVECLCSIEKNMRLRPNATIQSCGIKNGEHLILL